MTNLYFFALPYPADCEKAGALQVHGLSPFISLTNFERLAETLMREVATREVAKIVEG